MVPGDDVAGVIHEVGFGITEFKRGDRVAAFHGPRDPHCTFAEYTVVEANNTFASLIRSASRVNQPSCPRSGSSKTPVPLNPAKNLP